MFELDLDKKTKKEVQKLFGNLNKKQEKFISKIYELATKDYKTKLYNNRFFDEIFSIEIEKARRKKENLCLLINTDISLEIKYFTSFRGYWKKILEKQI
jgi:GGDEF domain-containing protein